MLASETVRELQALVEKQGDLPLVDEFGRQIDSGIEYNTDGDPAFVFAATNADAE